MTKKSETKPGELKFDSRRCPGSVVVYDHEYEMVAAITLVNKEGGRHALYLGHHVDIRNRLDDPLKKAIEAIPVGDYATVKASVTKAYVEYIKDHPIAKESLNCEQK